MDQLSSIEILDRALRVAALVQSLVVGTYLLNTQRHGGFARWIGWFLVAYAISLLPWMVQTFTNFYARYPRFMYFPTGAYYAITPLLYSSVLSLVGEAQWKRVRKHFIPVLVEIAALGLIVLLPPVLFDRFSQSPVRFYFAVSFTFGVSILAVGYAVVALRFLYQRKASLSERQHRLASNLVIAYLLTNALDLIIVHFIVLTETWRSFGQLCDTVLAILIIYWASLASYHNMVLNGQSANRIKMPIGKTRMPVQKAGDVKIFERARQFLDAGGYRDPKLNIQGMSRQLEVPRKELSRIINHQTGSNFKHLVARHRVEAAKQQLRSSAAHQLSYDGIAREVGFQSKSTFYRQFKELTGETPGTYQKRISTQPE